MASAVVVRSLVNRNIASALAQRSARPLAVQGVWTTLHVSRVYHRATNDLLVSYSLFSGDVTSL